MLSEAKSRPSGAFEQVELISTREASEILKVTTQAICKMIWDGRLKATKLGNATSPWRINKASVVQYIKQAT
jgi:excisionase family DNA binding protein